MAPNPRRQKASEEHNFNELLPTAFPCVYVMKRKLLKRANIMFLDIIYRPVFIGNIVLFVFQNTKFRRLDSLSNFQVKPSQLGLIDRTSPYFRREKYNQEGVLHEKRTMFNVQKHNICTNVPPRQTFRDYI
jgi:hypothetical protein